MFFEDQPEYLARLPDNWRELLEVQAIGNAVEIQMKKLFEQIKHQVNNKSVSHANEIGIARWETILNLDSPLNSSLQARRDAARAKLMTKPPINLKSFRAVVEAYMGLSVDVELRENWTVRVWYRGQSRQVDLRPLLSTVYEMIPAELIVEILYRFLVWDELDSQLLTWDELDAKKLNFNEFERGEWVG